MLTSSQITNAANSDALPDAKAYLEASGETALLAAGDPDAVPHWARLREKQHAVPLGMQYYDTKMANRFGVVWNNAFPLAKKFDEAEVKRRWADDENLAKMREVFDEFGKWVERLTGQDEPVLWMGIGCQLYARLPLGQLVKSDVASLTDDCFYEHSSLPTQNLVMQWGRLSERFGVDEGSAKIGTSFEVVS